MKGKVLIVDDETSLRELLVAALSELYDVAEAGTGAELQQFFFQTPPDVVLLDVQLPDANGLDLLPQLKKSWPDT